MTSSIVMSCSVSNLAFLLAQSEDAAAALLAGDAAARCTLSFAGSVQSVEPLRLPRNFATPHGDPATGGNSRSIWSVG
ncbi:hypothetical protein B0H14DRAFT_2946798, partial [Mycena olivaceomarginata]